MINSPRCAAQTNSGILLTLLFHLSFDVPHMQTTDKQNVLELAEKIGVSLEPWALFVNICVSEIEQYYNLSH